MDEQELSWKDVAELGLDPVPEGLGENEAENG